MIARWGGCGRANTRFWIAFVLTLFLNNAELMPMMMQCTRQMAARGGGNAEEGYR